jgi:hypothetical protein
MTPLVLFLLHGRARSRWHCRGYVLLLPPSGGPTQAGTTPSVAFRAVVAQDGEVNLAIIRPFTSDPMLVG